MTYFPLPSRLEAGPTLPWRLALEDGDRNCAAMIACLEAGSAPRSSISAQVELEWHYHHGCPETDDEDGEILVVVGYSMEMTSMPSRSSVRRPSIYGRPRNYTDAPAGMTRPGRCWPGDDVEVYRGAARSSAWSW